MEMRQLEPMGQTSYGPKALALAPSLARLKAAVLCS